jgi:hypothetical protein
VGSPDIHLACRYRLNVGADRDMRQYPNLEPPARGPFPVLG